MGTLILPSPLEDLVFFGVGLVGCRVHLRVWLQASPAHKKEWLQFCFCLRVFALHPGITPLGNDPEWFKITRISPEMCLNGVNTQWLYSQGVIQKPSDFSVFPCFLHPGGPSQAILGLPTLTTPTVCPNVGRGAEDGLPYLAGRPGPLHRAELWLRP